MKLVKQFANEGLSMRRTSFALWDLYRIRRSPGAIAQFASANKIRFQGERGAPFGNSNRAGTGKRTVECRREQTRLRMQRLRQRRKGEVKMASD